MADEPLTPEEFIDTKLADEYFNYANPKNQKEVLHKSYDWHRTAVNSFNGIIERHIADKKIDFKDMKQGQALDLVSEYLFAYLESRYSGDKKEKMKKMFRGHYDKLSEQEKSQYLTQITIQQLGAQDQNFFSGLVGAVMQSKSREEMTNYVMETGRKHFWEQKSLLNYEVNKRFSAAFDNKLPGVTAEYISKHKMFEPYHVEEKDWHKFKHMAYVAPHKIVPTLVDAYHTGSRLSLDEIKDTGIGHKKVEYAGSGSQV